MKPLTKENILKFMSEIEPSPAARSWRVADLYDWLGGKSRIPTYYKMKSLAINQREPLAKRIYNRQYNQYRRRYVKWAREIFNPFLVVLAKQGEVKAISSRWGFCDFFEFQLKQHSEETASRRKEGIFDGVRDYYL